MSSLPLTHLKFKVSIDVVDFRRFVDDGSGGANVVEKDLSYEFLERQMVLLEIEMDDVAALREAGDGSDFVGKDPRENRVRREVSVMKLDDLEPKVFPRDFEPIQK